MNMNDRVKDIKVIILDKSGNITETKHPDNRIRLSVFVTCLADSHHIEFPEEVGRGELSHMLHELADRVAKWETLNTTEEEYNLYG